MPKSDGVILYSPLLSCGHFPHPGERKLQLVRCNFLHHLSLRGAKRRSNLIMSILYGLELMRLLRRSLLLTPHNDMKPTIHYSLFTLNHETFCSARILAILSKPFDNATYAIFTKRGLTVKLNNNQTFTPIKN